MAPPRVPLGELLVDAQIITREQLEEVLVLQKEDGRRLGTLLVDTGLVTETQVTQILSQQLSVPWVSLYHIDFSRQLLNLVPRELAEAHCLVPIFVRRVRGVGETLYVAMDDPSDESAQEAVSEYAGLPVRPMIAPPSDITNAIRVYYGGTSAGDDLASASDDEPDTKVEIKRPSQQPDAEAKAEGEAKADEAKADEAKADEAKADDEAKAEDEAKADEAKADEAKADEDEADEDEADEDEADDQDTTDEEPAAELASGVMPKAEPIDAPTVEVGEADAEVLAELAGVGEDDEDESADEPLESRLGKKPPTGDRLTPEPESGEIPAHEPAMPAPKEAGRAARMITLTLLDGTQVSLPARGKAARELEKAAESGLEQHMTARDLVTALRAASQGADASEILGDMSWQRLFAALLAVMMKKHLIADWEFIDELQSDGTPPKKHDS